MKVYFLKIQIKKIKKFSLRNDQKLYLNDVENKSYVNNFIFLPKKNLKFLTIDFSNNKVFKLILLIF